MRAGHSLRLVAAAAMLVALIEGPGCAFVADIDAPATETCTNGKTDQDKGEINVDCGGPCRGACPGSVCAKDTDCASFRCSQSRCASPACDDKVWNGTETDIDCGGLNESCPRCENAQHCRVADDCRSRQCAGGSCAGMCVHCSEFLKADQHPDPSLLCSRTSYDKLVDCCKSASCQLVCGVNCERLSNSDCANCLQKFTLVGCASSYEACRQDK